MKTSYIRMMVMLAGACWLAACTKGNDQDGLKGDTYTIQASADGTKVTPPNALPGKSSISGWYDASANAMNFTMRWENLWTTTAKDTISKALILTAPVTNQPGDSLRSIYIPAAKLLNATDSITYSVSGYLGLTEKEATAMLAGTWYYTIYTKKYPAGLVQGGLNAVKK